MSGAIGVFDSGIGGLTVASAIKKHLPNQQIIYFGDTLHLPYGDKSSGKIKEYIKAISAFLFDNKCEHLVVACNSASSVLLSLKNLPPFSSITNVIEPVVGQVIANPDIKNVGIIGTKRTINSHMYKHQIEAVRADITVHELATPLLAPMIEEGFVHDSIAEQVIHEYLSELPEIDSFYNGQVKLFDAPDVVANTLKKLVHVNEAQPISDHFYVSDYTASFEKTARLFFGEAIRLEKSDLFPY